MMLAIILKGIPGVHSLVACKARTESYGVILNLDIALYYGYNAQNVLYQAQVDINRKIERYTAINVITVNIRATRLVHQHRRAN